VDEFVAATAADPTADAFVAMARSEAVLAAAPGTLRTWLRFSDGAYSGCNLFLLRTPAALGVVRLWQELEAGRKRPLALLRRLGFSYVLRYRLGWLALPQALARLSQLAGGADRRPRGHRCRQARGSGPCPRSGCARPVVAGKAAQQMASNRLRTRMLHLCDARRGLIGLPGSRCRLPFRVLREATSGQNYGLDPSYRGLAMGMIGAARVVAIVELLHKDVANKLLWRFRHTKFAP
jgi:hypothetical protein